MRHWWIVRKWINGSKLKKLKLSIQWWKLTKRVRIINLTSTNKNFTSKRYILRYLNSKNMWGRNRFYLKSSLLQINPALCWNFSQTILNFFFWHLLFWLVLFLIMCHCLLFSFDFFKNCLRKSSTYELG